MNGYRNYLDPVDFADYFVLNVLTRNGDGLLISMFPWKGDDGKLRMGPAWDYNWSAYLHFGAPTGSLLHRSDQLWYRRLFADPDFHAALHRPLVGHAPRRDEQRGHRCHHRRADRRHYSREGRAEWHGQRREWTNSLAQMKTWLKDRANWIDSNYLRPPAFNQNGGDVPDGFQVTIYGTNGTIYFTTDGSDPRAPGRCRGGQRASLPSPVRVYAQTMVQARDQNGTNWSGLTTAVFYHAAGLHPSGPDGDHVSTRRRSAAGAGTSSSSWNSRTRARTR